VNALVVLVTLLLHKLLQLEAAQQTRNVRFRGDQPVADRRTGQTIWTCSAKNAKNVVLRSRDAMRLEALL